uniref:Prostaglandin reductase 1 n=1 Tax=Ciona intestinalis TaxID=7719 RepID=H2XYH1_CIOIN|nr:prostaglandin reductase 1 isoform X1 [Ciona intestinalis]|eukprot:XP_002127717.1 prostaglandin reductase 1 isoform X1 [Ciona intestinalis]
MVHSKYLAKTREFDGMPKLNDFEIIEEEIDETLKDGEVIGEAICTSVDPFIRAYPIPPGVAVPGLQVLRVTKSANSKYPVGCKVMGNCGWRTTCKISDDIIWYKVEGDLSDTVWLGALGMPGISAYCGFLDICSPKPGETVMVNACSGAVGSIVGQIAKIKGCKVIGCCGSDAKIEFSKSIGFDEVFNYKTCGSYTEVLKKLAPNGIDCFFDNVGGQLSSDIMSCMNMGGRIAVCGAITAYNSKEPVTATVVQPDVVLKQLSIKGFLIYHLKHRFSDALKEMVPWVSEGKIKTRETVTTGFENIPRSFIDMLGGKNIGKAVVVL